MIDVVFIGGGEAGAPLAEKLGKSGLSVAVVEKGDRDLDGIGFMVYRGIGVVKTQTTVIILDSKTGDEQRILECRAIVLATGKPDAVDQASKMLGIDKLGIRSKDTEPLVHVRPDGTTAIRNIFAVGDCAQIENAHTEEAIIKFCESKYDRSESL